MTKLDELDSMYSASMGWGRRKLDAVRLAIGCYLCPRWPGQPSPAWGVLQGAPSCGKSTILSMFEGYPFTVSVDHITKNALSSCYTDEDDPAKDHSLFAQLAYLRDPVGVKVWIVQELSSILSGDQHILEQQLADLRAAHVGRHVSHGGVGGTRVREIGSFGMLVGTTDSFEKHRESMSIFGDRFLVIRLDSDDTPDNILQDAMSAWGLDSSKHDQDKKDIRKKTHEIIADGIRVLDNLGGTTDCGRTAEQQEKLAKWAALYSLFATNPPSQTFTSKAAGRPYRIIEQLKSWANTHCAIDGRREWGDHEMRIVRRVLHDSMMSRNMRALRQIADADPAVGHPTNDFQLAHQWAALGGIEKVSGTRNGWKMSKFMKDLIDTSGFLQGD